MSLLLVVGAPAVQAQDGANNRLGAGVHYGAVIYREGSISSLLSEASFSAGSIGSLSGIGSLGSLGGIGGWSIGPSLSYERKLGTVGVSVTLGGSYRSARSTEGSRESGEAEQASQRVGEFSLGVGPVLRKRVAPRVDLVLAPHAVGGFYTAVQDSQRSLNSADPDLAWGIHQVVRTWAIDVELGVGADIELVEGAYLTMRARIASAGYYAELMNVWVNREVARTGDSLESARSTHSADAGEMSVKGPSGFGLGLAVEW